MLFCVYICLYVSMYVCMYVCSYAGMGWEWELRVIEHEKIWVRVGVVVGDEVGLGVGIEVTVGGWR